jgi:hypothetical protein
METGSLRFVECTTKNEKTTRLFSSSRVVSVRTGVTPTLVLLIVLQEVLMISAVFWRGRRRLDEVARNAYAEGYGAVVTTGAAAARSADRVPAGKQYRIDSEVKLHK